MALHGESPQAFVQAAYDKKALGSSSGQHLHLGALQGAARMKRLMLRSATIKPVTEFPVPGPISPSNVPHVPQHPISILCRTTSIPILYQSTK